MGASPLWPGHRLALRCRDRSQQKWRSRRPAHQEGEIFGATALHEAQALQPRRGARGEGAHELAEPALPRRAAVQQALGEHGPIGCSDQGLQGAGITDAQIKAIETENAKALVPRLRA